MAEQVETLTDEEPPLFHDIQKQLEENKKKFPSFIGYPAITPEGEGIDPIEAAKRIPAEFKKTVEDVQTQRAKQAEEERLKKEQEERTRLRNIGQMGDPTDLVYRRSDGSTRTIKSDVDLRYAFGDNIQNFDISRTSFFNEKANNRPETLFSLTLPRTPDGKVGNPDGSAYGLNHFMRDSVIPFVNNHLSMDITRMYKSGGKEEKEFATHLLYKSTLNILKNNSNVLEYFRENDPKNMTDFLNTLEKEGIVAAETKYGKKYRTGETGRIQREMDLIVPRDPISLAGRIERIIKLPYWIAGTKDVTIDPFNQKQIDDIVKLDEQRTFWNRGINWHLINFAAVGAEMAAGAVNENARSRSLTEFATNWGPILNLTPKKLGEMGNWMVRKTYGLGKLMGYSEFSEEELNRPDLTFTDITDATPISVQDSIMTAIATQMPSVFGHTPNLFGLTPEDRAAITGIRDVTGTREAEITKPGYAPRFDPETLQIAAEGRPQDISDIVGFGISLFAINAAATRGLAMGARKLVNQQKLATTWKAAEELPTRAGKTPLGSVPSVYKSDGTFDKAELAKLMRALDEGHDIAGLGLLNLRASFPGGRKKHFFRNIIMNATNHPFQQAGWLQLALATSIGGVEILNESLINEDGRYMNPFNPNEELSPRTVLGLNLLAGLAFPLIGLPVGATLFKAGFNKTLAASFMELNDPKTYELIKQIRDRAPEVNFSQASKFVRRQLQGYRSMREDFPEQAKILWEAFDELNSGGVKYAETMRRVGASEKEIQEQLTAFREITAHVWAFGSLGAAVTYYSTAKGIWTVKGGLSTKNMTKIAEDAQNQAMLMANQHMSSLSIARGFSKLVKSLEDQQTRTAKEVGIGHNIDAVGINDAILKYQKMMANVLETTIGGVNPKELSDAMVKVFRVTDDYNRGEIDLTEARKTIKSAVDGLTDPQDQQLFLQNIFLARDGELLGDLKKFDEIMDEALPELRDAINMSNIAAADLKAHVAASVLFDKTTGTHDFPVRPPTNAKEQHALVMKAFEEVKKLSDKNWKEVFDGVPGPQEKEFDITPLIEMMDELAKANEHGPISTGKLGGLIRQVQKMNPDTNIAVQLARSDVPDEGDFPLEVLLERGRTGGEGLSLTFQQYHALRSDVNQQLMAEFKKGTPDAGYINLLQRISHTMDDAIEVKLQQDPDAAALFRDANDFWRDHVAAPFFNNKALAMTHGEQFHGLFTKLFSRDGIDGQRQTFDRMFPEQKDGVDNPDRKRALELLKEAMIREVIGDRPSMNRDEFFFALREKASKENPGMFSAPTVDADGNITGGGFLDVLMGSVASAKKFDTLNIMAPNIDDKGHINTLAPNIHIGASTEKAFGSLQFAVPQSIKIQDNVLEVIISNAATQINKVRVNKINDLNKGFWKKLEKQDNKSPNFTRETLDWILKDNDGKLAAQIYKALFDDMNELVGESEALAYQEYINRALIKDLHNNYMQITKAVSPSELLDPKATVKLKDNIRDRKEYFIQYRPLFREALGGDTEAVGYLLDMVSMAEQPAMSIIRFSEQVNQFTANGALSRAWGVARNVVSPRYVISEWFLRSMLANRSEVLIKMLSTPDLAPYLMDAVRVGQTPYKVQFFYKTQLIGAMVAGENDVDKIDEIQENIETWFKQSQENGDDFIQHTLSMYFAAQNPQMARLLLHEMDQRKQGKSSNLLEIMQRQLKTPRGVQERLQPRQIRNPLTQTLGLGNE